MTCRGDSVQTGAPGSPGSPDFWARASSQKIVMQARMQQCVTTSRVTFYYNDEKI